MRENIRKKLGIIGGMGSRASMHFLNRLHEKQRAHTDQEFIEFVYHNNSSISDRTRAILSGNTEPVLKELNRSFKIVEQANVDFIVLLCITAHYFIPFLPESIRTKILNPIQFGAKYIQRHYKNKKIGLIATTGTIQANLFQHYLSNQLVLPDIYAQEEYFMKSLYTQNGLKSSETSSYSINLLEKHIEHLEGKGADLIITGCSEVPFALESLNTPPQFIDIFELLAEQCLLATMQKKEMEIL